jgi:bifunctional UDP-N-acetylglucosamine pyrophosphorylase/glucosamine-1-phosphate N-acetyltransferase
VSLGVIILAAGQGKRMKSAKAKVLHEIGSKSMLQRVIETATCMEPEMVVTVLKHQTDEIQSALKCPNVVIQSDVPGTGSAALAGLEMLPYSVEHVLILSGDTPLISSATLEQLYSAHLDAGNTVTILSARPASPEGYGRILKSGESVVGIVEQKDATDEELEIREVNSGVYLINAQFLREALPKIGRNNAQNEMYLTDIVYVAAKSGLRIGSILAKKWQEVEGVNDRIKLMELTKFYYAENARRLMENGVTLIDADSTWIDDTVKVGEDVTIEPNCLITGQSEIGAGSCILLGSRIVDASVGVNVKVGPYAYLRPGTVLNEESKAGTFVEIKNSIIGKGTKVPHLSYVGDAEIGDATNVGAGSIFANYDGVQKHKTKIGKNVKLGSKTILVAPVEVGDEVYTGAGSLIRADIAQGSLAYSRNEQVVVDGWVDKNRG